MCRKVGGLKKSGGPASRKMKTGTPGHKSMEAALVFRSYDKSSGVSLRSSKVSHLITQPLTPSLTSPHPSPLFPPPPVDENSHDIRTQESKNNRAAAR